MRGYTKAKSTNGQIVVCGLFEAPKTKSDSPGRFTENVPAL